MTKPAASNQRDYVWLVAGTSLVAATFSWVTARQAGWLDREILERLLIAFGDPAVSPVVFLRTGQLTVVLQLAVVLTFSTVAVLAGFRLAAVPRTMALAQLFVLMLLSQWGLAEWLHFAGNPLAGLLAVFLGLAGGYLIRRYAGQQTKYESQFYELLLRNRELNETKLQIVRQDEVERRMLAADLHDQVLNDLKAIGHKFDSYIEAPEIDSAQSIKGLLNQAMSEIREVMDSLCPSALEHLGLAAAIEDCLRRGAERGRFKGRVRSKLKGPELDGLSMVEQSLLYRLVQESITNICKHAQATTVRASLDMENEQVVIRIADDGKGMDPSQMKADSRGLRYMRQRADLIGATIAWHAGDDGKGTVVEIRMNMSGRKNGQQDSDS